MTTPRILIAGIGNIFLGDDAFGSEVAQRLARRPQPDGVRVVDFGIRGLDLAYSLLDGYDAVLLVDAVSRGENPGTLYVLEPNVEPALSAAEPVLLIEPHNLDPARVLQLVTALGGQVERLLVIGCEPATADGEEEMFEEMSDPVREAVDKAVLLIESLVTRLLDAGDASWPIADVMCAENVVSRKEV